MLFKELVLLFCQVALSKRKQFLSSCSLIVLNSVSLSCNSICCSRVIASWFSCIFLDMLEGAIRIFAEWGDGEVIGEVGVLLQTVYVAYYL